MIDLLRQHIAADDTALMYALVYFATREENGKTVDIVVSETGDREGAAPVFDRPFKLTKSGELKTKGMEFSEDIDNLWTGPQDDDDEELEEDAFEEDESD